MLHANARILTSIFILISTHGLAVFPAAFAAATQELQEHLSIPIRWCAMQGSPTVEKSSAVTSIPIDEILRMRHTRATVFVWMPRSGISFRSALTNAMHTRSGVPIIDDPHPPQKDATGGPGVEGDILTPSADTAHPSELETAITNCEIEWEKLEDLFEVNFEGIIGLNIRQFVRPDGIPSDQLGIGTSVHTILADTNECEVPSNPADYDPLISNDGWVAVVDNSFTSQSDPYDTVLAHELGHVLFLGHGNGMDDPIGNPPRTNGRYDTFCDSDEDMNAKPDTLMKPKLPVLDYLTELQRTSTRAVAKVTVGGSILQTGELNNGYIISDDEIDNVGEVSDPSVDLKSLGIHYNTIKGVTIISYRLVGHLPKLPNHRFVLFADIDADPTTGGDPTSLGYHTGFKGAELVTEVLVRGQEGESQTQITPTVWKMQSEGFAKLPPDPRIKADINTAVLGHTGHVAYDVISLQLPHGLAEPRPVKVRIQAIAERLGGELDRLPEKEEYGRLIRLTEPHYPVCQAIPDSIQPGAPITIESSGFIPNQKVKIFFDHERIGKGLVDHKASLTVEVQTPQSAKEGLHLLVVAAENNAITAHCAITINRGKVEKNSQEEPRASKNSVHVIPLRS